MTSRTSRGARTGLALAGIGLLLALTACAPNGADSADLKSGDSDAAYEEWSTEFTSCMKDEGIDIGMATGADGSASSGGTSDSSAAVDPDEIDLDAMAAAERTCFDKVGDPPPVPGQPDQEEMNEASLRFSACLRERGYDFDDPEISPDGAAGMTEAMSADEIDPVDADECGKQADFPTMDEE